MVKYRGVEGGLGIILVEDERRGTSDQENTPVQLLSEEEVELVEPQLSISTDKGVNSHVSMTVKNLRSNFFMNKVEISVVSRFIVGCGVSKVENSI